MPRDNFIIHARFTGKPQPKFNRHTQTHTETHRDTQRHTETHRDTQRHTETHRDTQRHTETHRDTHTQTDTHTDTHTDTQTDTHTDTHTDRHRQTQTDTDRHRQTRTDRDTQRQTHTHTTHGLVGTRHRSATYPVLGVSPGAPLLSVSACSSTAGRGLMASCRFSAESKAVRTAPTASPLRVPNPPCILAHRPGAFRPKHNLYCSGNAGLRRERGRSGRGGRQGGPTARPGLIASVNTGDLSSARSVKPPPRPPPLGKNILLPEGADTFPDR